MLLSRNLSTVSGRAVLVVLLLAAPLFASGTDTVQSRQGETPAQFAAALLPPNAQLAHPPVEVSLPAAALVVLYRPTETPENDTNFRGWVLMPATDSPRSYRRFPLPEMLETPGMLDIRVKDVFGVSAGKRRFVVVSCTYERTGCFSETGDAAYVYEWKDDEFTSIPELGEGLAGIKNVEDMRQTLRELADPTGETN